MSTAAEPVPTPKILGSLSCSAAACHGSQPVDVARLRPGEEFIRWLNTDPHAGAAVTLASEKYRDILLRVSGREDRQPDPQVQARCAKCHDPLGETGDHTTISAVGHGIGCETCHGPAEHWLPRHFERDIERSELTALGMLDTTNLNVRAKQCVSCHIGSTDQDMNHDMIAAGHPPLRFELSAYHDLIRHKHWNDTRERLETRDYQVQLWAAGQSAGASARLELLAARCGGEPERWPELAEHNCFSCHQRIRGSDQLAVRAAGRGRPAWSHWNLIFVDALQSSPTKLEEQPLTALRAAFQSGFPADQEAVRNATVAARLQLQTHSPARNLTANDLLKTLSTSLRETANADWETRCQQYLALTAAERAYRDELAKRQHFARLDQTEYNRRLSEEKTLLADLQQVRSWLEFEPGSSGVLSAANKVLRDEPLLFHEHRGELGSQLQRIADRLQVRMLELP